MSRFCFGVVVLLLWATTFAAVSKQPQGEHKSRVVDENLSKSPHDVDGVHNPAYDREALFGEESKQLDSASPEDRLTQLGILADKMDEDRDGYVTPEELRVWLKKVHQHLANTDARKTWTEYELNPTDTLSWEHYSRHMVGEDGEYEARPRRLDSFTFLGVLRGRDYCFQMMVLISIFAHEVTLQQFHILDFNNLASNTPLFVMVIA
ncbi:hypothetical protein AHF37_06634 [Paragonimus kellicotti]|nr:hypothetical protein AHF37_06634 [Paragonimus kellicotti]